MIESVCDFATRVAEPYVLHGVAGAFNKCERQSALLEEHLLRLAVPVRRYRGDFSPATEPATWHKRWLTIGWPPYIHYWVEVGGVILDPTAAQFGYESLVTTPSSNAAYAILGDVSYSFKVFEPGTRRHPGMLCVHHTALGAAVPVTHATPRADGTTIYLCEEHAAIVVAPGKKIRPAWRPR